MNKKIIFTVLTLLTIGNAITALGQSTVYEEVRFGNNKTGTANTDWVLNNFSATLTSVFSSAPGISADTSARFAASPPTGGASFVVSPTSANLLPAGGQLVSGTTYAVAITFPTNSSAQQAEAPDVLVTASDTGTTGIDTLAGITTAAFQTAGFQSGNANTWVTVGLVTLNTATPTFTFTWAGGTTVDRWYANAIQFTPVPALATAQYWDTGSLGGSGSWDATTPNWNPNSDGSGAPQTYNQADLAYFSGTAGTVTIDPVNGITTDGGLLFATNGYVLQTGTLTLGLGTNITVTGTNVATINSPITGVNGLCTFGGSGTLILGAGTTATLAGAVAPEAGTLLLGGNNTFSTLAGPGGGILALANYTLSVGDATTSSFGGVISDTSAASPGFLIKQGSGILTLTGPNTFHGNTTINQGTIRVSTTTDPFGTPPPSMVANQLVLNGGRLDFTVNTTLAATRGITLNGNCTFSTPGTGTVPAITGPISGSGSMIIPSGGFDLKTANSFSGGIYLTATPIDSGGNNLCSVRFDAAGSSGTGKIFVSPTTAVNCTLRNLNTAGTIVVPNAMELDPFASFTQIYLAGGASGANFYTITFSGNINGAASAIIGLDTAGGSSNPGGQVNLSGSNTLWTGGATLQAGTLGLGSSNAIGTGGLFLVPQGPPGVLLATTPLTGPSAVTNSIGINTAVSGLTFGGANSLQLAGPVFLYGSSTLNISNTASTIISGSISDFGSNYALTIGGNNSSVLTLTASNSYTGGTTNTGGTLDISTGSIQGNVTLNGGILELDNNTALATTNTINFVSGLTGELDLTYPANTPMYIAILESVGSPQPSGTYGAPGSGATYTFSQLTGTGILVVGATPTTTTITGPTSVTYGNSPTYTATVTGGTPAGTVQFYVDGVATGSAVTLSGSSPYTAQQTITAQSQASPAFDVCSGSPVGTHQISAVFTPSAPLTYVPSTSANYPVTVTTLASITVSGTRPYDGATDANASVLTVSGGTLFGDTVTVASGSGSVASAGVSATPQAITPGTLALGGAQGCDYTVLSGSLTITNSFPKLTNTTSVVGSGPSATLQVCWQTIPGVIYHVYTNANLMNGQNSLAPSWVEDTATTPPSPITGDGGIDCVTLPCAAPLTNNFVLIKQTTY